MKKLCFVILFLSISIGSNAQKNLKKAYILRDGVEISYAEYRLVDPTRFSEIKILAGNKEIVKIFGKKAKRGIVHLKSYGFIETQKILLDSLVTGLKSNTLESVLIIINSVPYDSKLVPVGVINQLNYDTVEIIKISDNSGIVFDQKHFFLIQTNKEI